MDTQLQKSFNILVIGDACIDKYSYGFCERLSPEAPVPVLRHSHTEEREGMCLNVRNNLTAFGATTTVRHNKSLLSKERFVDLKTKQHILRFDMGEGGITDSPSPMTLAAIKKLNISSYNAVVISDYNKGFITHENAAVIAELCSLGEVPLFVDSKKRDLSCFSKAYIKINQQEHNLVQKLPLQYELVVTLGAKGARWQGQIYETHPCEVFDVSGAGDTFLAAMVAEFLKTGSLAKAIAFANNCASIAVQKFGTYVIQQEDIDGN